ncbi:very short patch repair endonuclease [Streptomyces mutabilis]
MAHAAGYVTTETVPANSWASSAASRAVMSANKGRDTKPEKRLRSALHRQGLRYRVGVRPLPGLRRTADVVFTKARVAVFVDGCYWHGCPEHHRPAKKGAQFWREKIAGNRARDAETNEALNSEGWFVIRVWEHEDPERAALEVARVVASRRDVTPRAQS